MGKTIAVNKDEVHVKTEKTEITHTKEAISVSAPKISLESGKLEERSNGSWSRHITPYTGYQK